MRLLRNISVIYILKEWPSSKYQLLTVPDTAIFHFRNHKQMISYVHVSNVNSENMFSTKDTVRNGLKYAPIFSQPLNLYDKCIEK